MGEILEGDCLEVMRGMEESSVDSIVCDPPYELTSIVKRFGKSGAAPAKEGTDGRYARLSKGFMGKTWDGTGIAMRPEVWEECLRVAKPGAYLLAFGGTRTFHRLACAIEDAGWVLKDTLSWNYGSGFPKSHDISKAIDKRGGANHLVGKIAQAIKGARIKRGLSSSACDKRFCGGTTNWSWFEGRPSGVRIPSDAVFSQIADAWSELKPLADIVAKANREVTGKHKGDMGGLDGGRLGKPGGDITASATPEAKQWEGFGTALKPAWEPAILAQSPLEGTYAENVLKWGCGALNIDGCRIGAEKPIASHHGTGRGMFGNETAPYEKGDAGKYTQNKGRWPANFLMSHSVFCEKVGEREVKGPDRNTWDGGASYFDGSGHQKDKSYTKGGGGKEKIDVWRCVPDCPIAILDGQSGAMGMHGAGSARFNQRDITGQGRGTFPMHGKGGHRFGDKGGASRFFYCAKASRRERNAGLEEFEATASQATALNPTRPVCNECGCGTVAVGAGKTLTCRHTDIRFEPSRPSLSANKHPCVKPIAILRYLCRLVTPPGGIVLDPFAGSGSTGCAAALEGFESISIEKEREYVEIAKARIAHFSPGK